MEYLWLGDFFDGEFFRGVYEAANKARPRNAGTHLWKVNASWPSMVWQLFDWYLHPNSGYYQMKKALQPLHVQYSIDDDGIQVVSTRPDDLKGARVHAEVISLTGAPESAADFKVDAAADATTPAGSLAGKFADNHAHFLALTLTAADGRVLEHDVRWVADDDVCWEMQTMAPATVVGTVKGTHVDGVETVHTIGIENTSDLPACDVRSEILSGPQGGELLPTFWIDNALILMPHEKREVTVRYRTAQLAGAEPHLMIEGFNVVPRETNIADGKSVPLSTPPDANNVTTIKLWFLTTDPGSGPAIPSTKKNPDETIFVRGRGDSTLRVYPFARRHDGQYVIMQLVGHGASVGGRELRLISR